MQVEATFQREGKALCTGRSCRGRGGGRGSCCLMPLILLSAEASQSGSTTAPETGLEEKAVLSSHPSSKVKPKFSCVTVQELLPQRTQTAIDDRLGHLTHCNSNGHTTLCSVSEGMMILRSQDSYAEQGSRSCFSGLCTWNLFIQSNFILKTRSSVQPEKHGAPWV